MEISKRLHEYVGIYLSFHDRVINGVFYRFISLENGGIDVIKFVSHYEDEHQGTIIHSFRR